MTGSCAGGRPTRSPMDLAWSGIPEIQHPATNSYLIFNQLSALQGNRNRSEPALIGRFPSSWPETSANRLPVTALLVCPKYPDARARAESVRRSCTRGHSQRRVLGADQILCNGKTNERRPTRTKRSCPLPITPNRPKRRPATPSRSAAPRMVSAHLRPEGACVRPVAPHRRGNNVTDIRAAQPIPKRYVPIRDRIFPRIIAISPAVTTPLCTARRLRQSRLFTWSASTTLAGEHDRGTSNG
jgi:hypothetical protein